MITTAILYMLYAAIVAFTAPLRFLNDVSLDSGVSAAINTAGGYLAALDPFIPIYTLLQIIGAILTIELLIILYKVVMWIVRKIPGVG